MQTKKRIAVVIGAGSVKCAAGIGLAKVLAREGIDIDLLVGASGGSMFAAVMAQGLPHEQTTELVSQLWTRDLTSQRDNRAMLSALLPRMFGFDEKFGMKSDTLVMQRLQSVFGNSRIEGTKTQLLITATDFHTGEQVVFSRGKLTDAIRASISIPFIFKPWTFDGRTYIDGFMSDPLPVGPAVREGADIIIAMGFDSPMQENISSPTRFAFQLSSIMNNNLQRARFAFHNAAHHGEVIAIVPEFEQRVRLFDTAKIPYIIEEGERATEAILPQLHRMLAQGERSLAAVA
jgi:NTE family protein